MTVMISDTQLVRMFEQLLKNGAAVWKNGTYNRQDPTSYKKSEVWFVFEMANPITQEQGDCFYHVFYHDVTWGVTIRVRDEADQEVWEAYLDYQDGKWVRVSNGGNDVEVNNFLLACMSDGEIRTKKPDWDAEELAHEAAAQAHRAERDAGWDPHP